MSDARHVQARGAPLCHLQRCNRLLIRGRRGVLVRLVRLERRREGHEGGLAAAADVAAHPIAIVHAAPRARPVARRAGRGIADPGRNRGGSLAALLSIHRAGRGQQLRRGREGREDRRSAERHVATLHEQRWGECAAPHASIAAADRHGRRLAGANASTSQWAPHTTHKICTNSFADGVPYPSEKQTCTSDRNTIPRPHFPQLPRPRTRSA